MTPQAFIKKFKPLTEGFKFELYEYFQDFLSPNLFKREANAWLVERGFGGVECLGCGASRVAFKIGERVVKYQFAKGCNQNKTELRFWKKVSRTPLKNMFLPVEPVTDDPNVLFLVTPLAKMVREEHKTIKSFYKKIDVVNERHKYLCISDMHSTNVGLYQGKGVVIDMGDCRLSLSMYRKGSKNG